ncbi:hypothetical protein BDQ17DRAFT_1323589 [Cyathus striatus]|nr:hypothetical protein BDQ17DRAFT_1323589 [Cyathus striatus]
MTEVMVPHMFLWLLLQKKLIDDYIPPKIDLSSISSKCKVVPQPTTTFAPASKHSKASNVEVIIPVRKINLQPNSSTPSVITSELDSASGYHLHGHSLTTTLALAPVTKSKKSTQATSKAPAKGSLPPPNLL